MLDAIKALWPLSENYEYASELGLALRNSAPGWWQEFEKVVSPERYPLPQAQGYAFLAYLENADVDRELLLELLDSAFKRFAD